MLDGCIDNLFSDSNHRAVLLDYSKVGKSAENDSLVVSPCCVFVVGATLWICGIKPIIDQPICVDHSGVIEPGVLLDCPVIEYSLVCPQVEPSCERKQQFVGDCVLVGIFLIPPDASAANLIVPSPDHVLENDAG